MCAQESYGGEDAFFVSDVGGGAFGIADGVGGWQESGINPAGSSPRRVQLSNPVSTACPCSLDMYDFCRTL